MANLNDLGDARALQNLELFLNDNFQEVVRNVRGNGLSFVTSRAQIDVFYEEDWIYKRACDYIPSLAVKEGGRVVIKGEEFSQKEADWLDERVEDLDMLDYFRDAGQLANRYGGAALIILTDDGLPYSKPLDANNPGVVVGFRLKTLYEIAPSLGEDYYRPEYYSLLSFDNGEREDLPNGKIHRSRIIPFYQGPRRISKASGSLNGWTAPILSFLRGPIENYRESLCKAADLLRKHSMLIHGVSGLKAHGEKYGANKHKDELSALKAQIESNVRAAAAGGFALYDKTSESIEYINRQLSGVYEIVKLQKDELIGASGLTPGILFNDFASGLNAGGANKSVENSEADIGEKYQSDILNPSMKKMLRILKEEDESPIKGKLSRPTWNWNPMSKIGVVDLSAAHQALASAHRDNIEMGIYSAEEARSAYGGAELNFSFSLSDKTKPVAIIPEKGGTGVDTSQIETRQES